MQDIENICKLGRAVIEAEAESIAALTHKIDHNFARACLLLLNCQGRIIVMGMGKSGISAEKSLQHLPVQAVQPSLFTQEKPNMATLE